MCPSGFAGSLTHLWFIFLCSSAQEILDPHSAEIEQTKGFEGDLVSSCGQMQHQWKRFSCSNRLLWKKFLCSNCLLWKNLHVPFQVSSAKSPLSKFSYRLLFGCELGRIWTRWIDVGFGRFGCAQDLWELHCEHRKRNGAWRVDKTGRITVFLGLDGEYAARFTVITVSDSWASGKPLNTIVEQ